MAWNCAERAFGKTALAFALLVIGAAAHAQVEKPDDVSWADGAAAPLRSDQLVDYSERARGNRFQLDLSSVAGVAVSVVRYSTVIESESGVRNVRHEAIRCASKERKLLAIGRADGTWSATDNPSWAVIGDGSSTNQGHAALFRALCFGGVTVAPNKVRDRLETKSKAY